VIKSEGYSHLPIVGDLTSYTIESEGNSNTVDFGKHKFSSYFTSKNFNTVKSNNLIMSFDGAH